MSSPPPHKRAKVQPKPDIFNETFNHPKADVILRCREGRKEEEGGATLFAVRRLVLVAASSFFEDLFDLPQGDNVEKVKWEGDHQLGSLPVVDLEESAEDIEVVFSLVHREHLNPSNLDELQLANCIDDFLRFFDIADKYHLAGAVVVLAAGLGELLQADATMSILGIALIHRQPQLASRAVLKWGEESMAAEESYEGFVGDIPKNIFHRMPSTAIRQILQIEKDLVRRPKLEPCSIERQDWEMAAYCLATSLLEW